VAFDRLRLDWIIRSWSNYILRPGEGGDASISLTYKGHCYIINILKISASSLSEHLLKANIGARDLLRSRQIPISVDEVVVEQSILLAQQEPFETGQIVLVHKRQPDPCSLLLVIIIGEHPIEYFLSAHFADSLLQNPLQLSLRQLPTSWLTSILFLTPQKVFLSG
jgi:hypothetical protein